MVDKEERILRGQDTMTEKQKKAFLFNNRGRKARLTEVEIDVEHAKGVEKPVKIGRNRAIEKPFKGFLNIPK